MTLELCEELGEPLLFPSNAEREREREMEREREREREGERERDREDRADEQVK